MSVINIQITIFNRKCPKRDLFIVIFDELPQKDTRPLTFNIKDLKIPHRPHTAGFAYKTLLLINRVH